MPDHFSSRFPFSDTHPGGIALGASYRRPGPLCAATMVPGNGRQQDREWANQLSWILFRISEPGQADRLPEMLAQLLGAASFTAGALAGFGRSKASAGIYSMRQVTTLLALAEMHESRNSLAFWRRLAPRLSGSALSAMAFAGIPAAMARDAQAAFDERKILLALVEACFQAGPGQGPIELDAEVARKYSLFKRYKNQPGLAGEHQFGCWFGELLMVLLGTKDCTRWLGDILPRVAGLQPLLLRLEKKLPLAKPAAAESASLSAAKKPPRPIVIAPADIPPLPLPSGKAKKDDYCAPCAAAAAALTAYPVDSINGCKVLLSADELDFNLPAALPFPWQRSYCSDNPTVGWLGQGWSLPISLALQFSRHHVTLLDEQHRGITFPHLKIGEAFYSRHEQITLKRTGMSDFELNDKNRLCHSFHLPDPDAKQAYLTRQQDANGNRIRIEYNQQHQPVRIIDAKGRNFALTFDERQRLIGIGEVLDEVLNSNAPPTALMHYEYDDEGDLVRVRNGANVVTREFAYKNHILVRHAVPDGLVSEYEYHEYFPSGRVMHNRTNTGVALKMAYVKGKTLITDALGRGTTHHFDEDNRYTGSVNALGQRQKLVRDSFGNVIAFTDHNGHTERYQYDGRSRLTQIDAPDGGVTQIKYDDGCDKPSKVTDPMKGITQYQYDKFGNLLKQTDPLGRTTEYSYNAQGQVSQIIDARGGSKKFEYNDNGQLIASTDCSGRTSRREYTAQGHLWRETDPLGNVTEYNYDNHGRKIATWHPDGSSEQVEYDSQGRVIREEDGNGDTTRFEYDAEGRLLKRCNALGGTLEYRYDQGQRLAQLVNENGAVHCFEYDFANHLVRETGFDQRTTHYRYDAMGKLIAKSEAGANGEEKDQIDTVYQRDKLGRLIGKHVTRDGQTASTRFAYDAQGSMVEAVNASATVRMAFDAGGQLIAEECELASGPVSRLQHVYDALGNRIQTILPDGRTLNRLYYGSGHLHQINLDGDVISDIERDEAHREIKRSQGALSSEFEYDPMGRMISQVANQRGGPQPAGAGAGSGAPPPAIAREYAWDDAGNLLAIDDVGSGSSRYVYDPAGRILRASQTGPDAATIAESFAFDAAHNLLDPATSVPDAALKSNRLTRYEDKFWAYDAHGNLIGKRIGHEVQMRLYWNSEHQLVRAMVKRQGVAQVSNTEYGYDPFGRRIFKRDAQGETRFVWDGNRLLAQVHEGQSTTWIYEADSFVPMAQVQTCASAGVLEILHIHTDHLGTPRELSDASGKVCWAARHKAWGALLPNEGTNALPEVHQPLRFQGQYFDVETGLHYNRFRYYDPDVGRFVSQDPIGLAGGENLYQYAPNPTGWVDPLGLWRFRTLLLAGLAAVGIVIVSIINPETVAAHPVQSCLYENAPLPANEWGGYVLPNLNCKNNNPAMCEVTTSAMPLQNDHPATLLDDRDIQIRANKDYLAENFDVIRIYTHANAGQLGRGHQAAAVAVMDQLTRDYCGTARMELIIGATRDAMYVFNNLLPGYNPALDTQQLTVNSCNFMVVRHEGSDTSIAVAFERGLAIVPADDLDLWSEEATDISEINRINKLLGTQKLLALNPHGWGMDERFLDTGSQSYEVESGPSSIYLSNTYKDVGMQGMSRIDESVASGIVQLASLAKSGEIDLWPSYGLHFADSSVGSSTMKPGDDITQGLVYSAFEYQRTTNTTKPVVIVNLSKQNLKHTQSLRKSKESYNYPGFSHAVITIEQVAKLANLCTDNVIFIDMGAGTPKDWFGLIMDHATLPITYEGANTANLAHQLGKSFMAIRPSGTTPLIDIPGHEKGQKILENAGKIIGEPKDKSNDFSYVGKVLADSKKPSSAVAKYIGAVLDKAKEIESDQLLMGLKTLRDAEPDADVGHDFFRDRL